MAAGTGAARVPGFYPLPMFARDVARGLGDGTLRPDSDAVLPYRRDPRCWWVVPVREFNPVRTAATEREAMLLRGCEVLRQLRERAGLPTRLLLTYKPYYAHAGGEGAWDPDFPFETVNWTTPASFAVCYRAWEAAGYDVWRPEHPENAGYLPASLIERVLGAVKPKGLPLWYDGFGRQPRMMAAVLDLGSPLLLDWCVAHLDRLRARLAFDHGVDVAGWAPSFKARHHHHDVDAVHPRNRSWGWALDHRDWSLPPTHPDGSATTPCSGLWGTPEADRERSSYRAKVSRWVDFVGERVSLSPYSWFPTWVPGAGDALTYLDASARAASLFVHVHGGDVSYRAT